MLEVEKVQSKRQRMLSAVWHTIVFLMLVTSLTLITLDVSGVIELEEAPFHQIDLAIMVIFWIEYLLRLMMVKHKGEYFKENFIELISILPFSAEFGWLHAFRLLRFVRLIKVLRLPDIIRNSRFWKFLRRSCKRISLFMNTKGFIYGLYGTILFLFAAAFGVEMVESLSYPAALWETVTASFTMGFGATPPSVFGKIVMVVILLLALGLVAWFIVTVVSFSRKMARIGQSVTLNFAGFENSEDELVLILKRHAEKYPLIQPVDVLKLIYQNEFGGEHLITDPEKTLEHLREEYAAVERRPEEPLYEKLGNSIVRVNLRAIDIESYPLEKLNEDFVRSAEKHKGSLGDFVVKEKILTDRFEEFGFGFAKEEVVELIKSHAEAGHPPLRHSEIYRKAYQPAYRIIEKTE